MIKLQLLRDTNLGLTFGTLFALVAVALTGTVAWAEDDTKETGQIVDPRDNSTIQTGSGDLYRTTVDRVSHGELSPDDLHQTSLLTSRIVGHLNKAVESLIDENLEEAKPEVEKAQNLLKFIREMLPVTTVTTTVKDSKGMEVYRDVDYIQNERIPLYRGTVALQVVQPILEAKEEASEAAGLRLAGADMIHTSMLADLGYIERKLNRAASLFDEDPTKTLAQLNLAQVNGIEFSVDRIDHPLIDAQVALGLAERMLEEDKHGAAEENLRLAKFHLDTYGGLIGGEMGRPLQEIRDDIDSIIDDISGEGMTDKVRQCWERVVSWFQEKPGQATVTTEEPAPSDETEDKQPS